MNSGHAARINERLLTFWRSIKPAAGLPLESSIDPSVLSDIWSSCFLIHITGKRDSPYEYVMLGQSLIEAYGDDWTGKNICEALVYPHPRPLLACFEIVTRSAEPHIEDNSFTNSAGLLVKYRSCLLPLAGKEGGAPEYILGGMKWKAY